MDRKKRLLKVCIFLLASWILTHSLSRLLPGDPISLLVAESGSQASVEFLRAELGLDLPWWKHLVIQFKDILQGDLGHSIVTKRPILPEAISACIKSFQLAIPAFILSLFFSLLIALLGLRFNFFSKTILLFSGITASIPSVLLGPLMMLILGVWLAILPLNAHLGIPMICIAISLSGFWSRVFYERLDRYRNTTQYLGAVARGLSNSRLFFFHWLLPCAPGLLGYLCTQLGSLLGGTLVMEILFDWPGLGSFFYSAVMRRDYPVIEVAAFLSTVTAIFGNFLGDELELYLKGDSSL